MVLKQMAAGFVLTLAGIVFLLRFFPAHPVHPVEPLRWAGTWSIPLSRWLILCIGTRARERFFHSAEIDGSPPRPGTASAIDSAVLQNTLEQTVAAFIAVSIFATTRPAYWYVFIPFVALTFSLGRALFWFGYHRAPVFRGLGFVLTFYPLLASYLYLAATFVRSL